ncbi:uncharacterized protein METZ01_LOCUS125382, partial [marine metagenome]
MFTLPHSLSVCLGNIAVPGRSFHITGP